MFWKTWDDNLKLRFVGEFATGLVFWMLFPFMAIYFSSALGKGMAGLLLLGSQLLSVAFQLVGGYWSDRLGRRTMMLWGMACQALGVIVMALANFDGERPYLMFFGFAIISIAGSLYWPASQAMIADLATEEERKSIFAYFYTATNISVVVGPLVGGTLFFTHRFELLFVAFVLESVLWVIYYFKLRESKPSDEGEMVHLSVWGAVREQLSNYRLIATNVIFLLFIVAGILSAQTFMQMDLLIGVHVQETFARVPFGLDAIDWSVSGAQMFSMIVATNGLLVVLTTVPLSKFGNRLNDRTVFVASSLLYAVSMLMFSVSSSVVGFLSSIAVFTVAEVIIVGLQNDFITKISPTDMRAQYFAAASLRFTIGRSIAPLAIPLAQWFGFTGTYIFISAITVGSALIYVWMFVLYAKQRSDQVEQVV
ncbi:MAG: MDR family MFS transporter [Bacilli bacterium]